MDTLQNLNLDPSSASMRPAVSLCDFPWCVGKWPITGHFGGTPKPVAIYGICALDSNVNLFQ